MNVRFQFPKRFLFAAIFLCVARAFAPAAELRPLPLSEAQQSFHAALAAQFRALEKKNAGVAVGVDGWLFLSAELRFLSLGCFWGEDAAKVSRSPKSEVADPIPAIVDFRDQLKARGIDLLLVPVPPKAAIYPEKIVPTFANPGDTAAPSLRHFYEKLRELGVDVLDLMPLLVENRDNERGAVYCKTDTHWSGVGCALAARAIAEKIQAKLPAPAAKNAYTAEWKEVSIEGDLGGLLKPPTPKPGRETIRIRTVREQSANAAVAPDADSPVLLLGDSHTLVFHDLLAEQAGLIDQLALELGFAPDLIGTFGSGATPVRTSLYRRSTKDPDYLNKKKLVVWCFTAREFTEAAQGWAKLPIAK